MVDPRRTIAVIDDDPSVRRGLDRLLRSAGFHVESYPSADAFAARGPSDSTGCLILDIHMDGRTGIELQEHLARAGVDIPIIFLTGRGDVPTSVRAMKSGAVDFLTKPVDDEILLESIQQALARYEVQLAQRSELEAIRQCLMSLTPREREVLEFVIAGKLNKQIAAELGTVEKTVKVHRGRMMAKMRVNSVAELVRHCARAGVQPRETESVPAPQ